MDRITADNIVNTYDDVTPNQWQANIWYWYRQANKDIHALAVAVCENIGKLESLPDREYCNQLRQERDDYREALEAIAFSSPYGLVMIAKKVLTKYPRPETDETEQE